MTAEERERRVLRVVAEDQLTHAKPSLVQHVLLSFPPEHMTLVEDTIAALLAKGLLELGREPAGDALLLAPAGLLLSGLPRAGEAARFAESLLSWLTTRATKERGALTYYTWEELKAAKLAQPDKDFELAVATIQLLRLSERSTWTLGPPPSASWHVPTDLAQLRLVEDISGLVSRAERLAHSRRDTILSEQRSVAAGVSALATTAADVQGFPGSPPTDGNPTHLRAHAPPSSSNPAPLAKPLRILHISDLHERAAFPGMPEERNAKLQWDAEERGYVLGATFVEALRDIANRGVDIVCFTGDLTDWGHPNEYAAATVRLDTILDIVGVPKDRFFAVPGNHDIQRTTQKEAWQGIRAWLADSHDRSRLGRWFRNVAAAPTGAKPEWREQLLERSAAFWDWLDSFRGTGLRPCAPKLLGYRSTLPAGTLKGVDVAVHVVGLDSAWMCGADGEQGDILVTEEQVQAHVRDGERSLDGLRIGLVHHPLDHLADHHGVRRLLADNGVDLLLHGHQHVPLVMVTDEPGARLRVLAAGCLIEGDLGKNWPNGFQLIEVDAQSKSGAAHFRKWARGARFWAKGSDIYREAPDGILSWSGVPPNPR